MALLNWTTHKLISIISIIDGLNSERLTLPWRRERERENILVIASSLYKLITLFIVSYM